MNAANPTAKLCPTGVELTTGAVAIAATPTATAAQSIRGAEFLAAVLDTDGIEGTSLSFPAVQGMSGV